MLDIFITKRLLFYALKQYGTIGENSYIINNSHRFNDNVGMQNYTITMLVKTMRYEQD